MVRAARESGPVTRYARRVGAAAVAAPTAPGAAYSQAEAQSAVAAINAMRVALKSAGITL